MNINFICKTNMPEQPVMINTVIFHLKDGSYITVDRDETYVDGMEIRTTKTTFNMMWEGCYIWNINDFSIFGDNGYHITDVDAIEEFSKLVSGVMAEFEIEDDATEGYEVELINFTVSL